MRMILTWATFGHSLKCGEYKLFRHGEAVLKWNQRRFHVCRIKTMSMVAGRKKPVWQAVEIWIPIQAGKCICRQENDKKNKHNHLRCCPYGIAAIKYESNHGGSWYISYFNAQSHTSCPFNKEL